MSKKDIKLHSDIGGVFWFAGWLFTLGLVKLSFWQGLLGLVIWPWYLGRFLGLPG